MRGRTIRDETGFTLPEMMVTIVVMITVLFALYNIFDTSIRVFSFGNKKVEAVENARLGLEKMEREIRAAYPYDKAGGNATLLPSGYSTSKITFGNDLNGNRKVDASDEQITYELSGGSPPTLLRSSQPTVEFVKPGGLKFEYLKKDGTIAGSESEVSIVRIKLSVEVPQGSRPPVAQELTTDVALRNRGE